MQYFALAAQIACEEACMNEEERRAFYADIPSFMHHFPHIHIMQRCFLFINLLLIIY
jgi:hypothetical protein